MTARSRALASASCLLLLFAFVTFDVAPAVAAPIKVQFEVQDQPGEGFNDPVRGPQRLLAFQFAAELWGGFFESAFAGQTVKVGIDFRPLTGFDAFATPLDRLIDLPPRVAFGLPLLDQLVGADLFPSLLGGEITFNEGSDFFLGTTGNPGKRLDFVTFALHELGHIFGFSSTLQGDGTYADGFPTVYDYGVQDQFGNDLVSLSADARLLAATGGNELFWSGPNGVAGNGGVRPNLSAGTPFEKGSNVLHLSNAFGPGDLLMDAVTEQGRVIRTLSAVERGIFTDLGWNLAPAQRASEPSTSVLLATALLILLAYVCARSRASTRIARFVKA
jgi:hypothetical protein